MKILYIECNMGAAGDMLMGALSELIPSKQEFLDKMNKIGIPNTVVSAETADRCGVMGTHVHVMIDGEEEAHHDHGDHHHHDHADHHHHDHADHHHHDHGDHHHHDHADQHGHYGLSDIQTIIEGLHISDKVKKDAQAVYQIIAQAESKVHGKKMEQIHFHEVGTLDAIADVVGNCMLMEEIGADQIVVSPIHVGRGTVKCAHGILPVPAPATSLILQGMPIYSGQIQGELCTPTGAAILKYFAKSLGEMPLMTVDKIGYGMGTKNFEAANCVRVFLGQETDLKDHVVELAANLDDMTAEEIGFAMEVLMDKGALDVYAEPITMKKSRPAVKLTCMIKVKDREKMAELMFKHTTTIGIREYKCDRMILERHMETVETSYGPVDMKICQGYGVERKKAEHAQLARIAKENQLSILDIKKEL